MSINKDYDKQFEVAKKKLETAIKDCFTAFEKKLMSDAIKRGIAEAKAKKQ